MNNSQIIASQQADALNSVDLVNRQEYDWLPMFELTAWEFDAKTIADNLLQIYFELAGYIFSDDVEVSTDTDMKMYTLRSVYEAFTKMTQNEAFKTTLNVVIQEK